MNRMLDNLIGPFIEVAGALMEKRSKIRFLSGATAVDNTSGDGSTDITITGDGNATSIRSKVVNALQALTGWVLSYNGSTDSWDHVRGVRVIASGQFSGDDGTPVPVVCAGIAAGDYVAISIHTPVQCTGFGPFVGEIANGIGFTVANCADDENVYNYYVIRPGVAPPA